MKTEQYEHHGTVVWTNSLTKGKHRDMCLCYHCAKFHPGTVENCVIAQRLFDICRSFNLVTPVLECQRYKGDKE